MTESRSFLDGKTTIIDGAVELTDQQGAITAHDFNCKVEGREAASVDIRSL